MSKIDPVDVIKRLALVEYGARTQKTTNQKEKFRLVSLFRNAQELCSYRVPVYPEVLNKEKTRFRCPKCKTEMYTDDEYTVDDFDLCQCCGQLWRTKLRFLEED